MRKARVGWLLLAVAVGIVFFTVAAGMLTPFTASPSPSAIVTFGVVVGVLLATLGIWMVFPCLGMATRTVAKRLAIAFALVLGIHAAFIFGDRPLRDAIPGQVAGFFYLGCVWIAPAMIYLAALYGAPILMTLQTGWLRTVRVAVLAGVGFALSFASMFAVLAIWAIASIMFGFPFREA
jgi:hypothetical protein